jgi:hypothetical protein
VKNVKGVQSKRDHSAFKYIYPQVDFMNEEKKGVERYLLNNTSFDITGPVQPPANSTVR